MAQSTLRPLSVGEILDGGFQVLRQHFGTMVGTGLILATPTMLLDLTGIASAQLLGVVSVLLLNGAWIWQSSQAVQGQPFTISEGIQVGLHKFFPLLAAAILYFCGIFVGFIGLIVGAFIMMIISFAWLPVVVLEGHIVFFDRSKALAKGAWAKISVVTLIASLVAFLPVLAVGASSLLFVDAEEAGKTMTSTFVTYALSLVTGPFSSAVVVLLYYDQRVRKEGFDVELSAQSLDDTNIAAQ